MYKSYLNPRINPIKYQNNGNELKMVISNRVTLQCTKQERFNT